MYDIQDKIATCGDYHNSSKLIFYNKDYIPFCMLFNLLGDKPSTMRDLINKYKNYTIASIATMEKSLRDWIDYIPSNFCLFESYQKRKATGLYTDLQEELYIKLVKYRAYSSVYKGYYTLINNQFNEIYFILMLKRTHIKYVKLCLVTGEPILEDCFEFWYDSKLIINNTRYQKLVVKIIKDLTSREIPCIDKELIISHIQPTIEFKAPTISKQKEMISEFVEDYQKYENKTT